MLKAETVGAVHIYIYIERFYKIEKNSLSKRAMYFRRI